MARSTLGFGATDFAMAGSGADNRLCRLGRTAREQPQILREHDRLNARSHAEQGASSRYVAFDRPRGYPEDDPDVGCALAFARPAQTFELTRGYGVQIGLGSRFVADERNRQAAGRQNALPSAGRPPSRRQGQNWRAARASGADIYTNRVRIFNLLADYQVKYPFSETSQCIFREYARILRVAGREFSDSALPRAAPPLRPAFRD